MPNFPLSFCIMRLLLILLVLVMAAPAAMATKDTTGTYANGQLRFKGELDNGQRHGQWTWYFEDGTVKKTEHYQNGARHGMSYSYRPEAEGKALNPDATTLYAPVTLKRFDTGKLVYEARTFCTDADTLIIYAMEVLADGKRITKRFESGKLESIEEYNSEGKEHGTHKRWNETGQMLYDYNYDNGVVTGAYRSWYSNGNMKSERAENSNIAIRYYASGVIEQIVHTGTDCGGEECFTRFYESGRRKEEKMMYGSTLRETTWALDRTVEQREYDGVYERKSGWFPTGSVWYSAVYFNGNGTMRWWHDNGTREMVQHYEHGKRTGTWQYWNKYGDLIREEMYVDGKLVDTNNP